MPSSLQLDFLLKSTFLERHDHRPFHQIWRILIWNNSRIDVMSLLAQKGPSKIFFLYYICWYTSCKTWAAAIIHPCQRALLFHGWIFFFQSIFSLTSRSTVPWTCLAASGRYVICSMTARAALVFLRLGNIQSRKRKTHPKIGCQNITGNCKILVRLKGSISMCRSNT
jgi:hypothetical protein